jgi:hypothetical protein
MPIRTGSASFDALLRPRNSNAARFARFSLTAVITLNPSALSASTGTSSARTARGDEFEVAALSHVVASCPSTRSTRSRHSAVRSASERIAFVGRVELWACSADKQSGATMKGILHQLVRRFDSFRVDERSDCDAVICASAHSQPRYPLGDETAEFCDHRLVLDEPVCRGAGLPGVAELRLHCAVDGLLQVGILEHEERGIAAELHARAEYSLRCLRQEVPAHR